MASLRDELAKWREANPWVLVNLQNSQAHSGRYATLEDAVEEAKRRGGVVRISEPSKQVFFSEMPLL